MRALAVIWLLASIIAGAQDAGDLFVEKFNAHKTLFPLTEVRLTLNQEKYSPGDTVFFNIYFLTENHLRVAGKEMIEIDLIDQNGQSITHVRAMVEDGEGHNQLVLPQNVLPGYYNVSAYSHWMRNFGTDTFFYRQIEIVEDHVLVPVGLSAISAAPEGGHLVGGVTNRVVIKGSAGFRVEVIDEAGYSIATAQLDSMGYGAIGLVPSASKKYKVAMGSMSVDLPPVNEIGWTLRVRNRSTDPHIQVVVQATPRSDLTNQDHFIILTGRGEAYFSVAFRQGDRDSVVVSIPKSGIGNGVVNASLLNRSGKVLAMRDFFLDPSTHIAASIRFDKSIYTTRENVTAEVWLQDEDGHALRGDFSVAVLNQSVASVGAREFANPRAHAHKDFDLVLNPKGVDWTAILDQSLRKPVYRFTNTIQRTGRAFIKTTGEPVPSASLLMFYLQRQSKVFQTIVLPGGKFGISMLDVTGTDELFYMAQTDRGKLLPELSIAWDTDQVSLQHAGKSVIGNQPDRYAQFVKQSRLIDNSYRVYSKRDELPIGPTSDQFDVGRIGGADIIVDMKDYVAFPTMADLLKEVVPSVLHRTRRGKSIIRIKLDPPNANSPLVIATEDPVYIIDGIATRSTAFFLGLAPTDLRSLKVVKSPSKLAAFGMMGRNGLIVVESKSGDTRQPLLPGDAIVGLSTPFGFPPVSGSLNIPQFRSTVYWNPSVEINGRVAFEFELSDDVGEMMVLIRGLTDQGIPFSAQKTIWVDNNSR
ncbi:MAG: hypothetical protein AB7K37_14145 [Cyclobacteriaceae bacterium]